MNKIKLICDSSCDLDFEYAKSLGIEVKPLSISFNADHSYYDGVDITVDELFQKVEEFNTTPKTAAMTPLEYENLFKKYISEGYDVIYTGIGGGFSSSYNTGCLVASSLDEGVVEVVDSENLSTGIALILFKALEWIKEGKDVHQVAELMRKQAKLVRSQFAIDTMDYLYKGGRCGGMAKIFGSILKIKPIILVRDNQMVVGGKPRGKILVAIDQMLEMLKADIDKLDRDSVITITHSKAGEYITYVLEQIEHIIPGAKTLVTNAGCIVSSHCGPGTIGIFYQLKAE